MRRTYSAVMLGDDYVRLLATVATSIVDQGVTKARQQRRLELGRYISSIPYDTIIVFDTPYSILALQV